MGHLLIICLIFFYLSIFELSRSHQDSCKSGNPISSLDPPITPNRACQTTIHASSSASPASSLRGKTHRHTLSCVLLLPPPLLLCVSDFTLFNNSGKITLPPALLHCVWLLALLDRSCSPCLPPNHMSSLAPVAASAVIWIVHIYLNQFCYKYDAIIFS